MFSFLLSNFIKPSFQLCSTELLTSPVTSPLLICTGTLFYLTIRIALSPAELLVTAGHTPLPSLPPQQCKFCSTNQCMFSPQLYQCIYSPPWCKSSHHVQNTAVAASSCLLFITGQINVTIACRNSIKGLLSGQQIKLALMDELKVGHLYSTHRATPLCM